MNDLGNAIKAFIEERDWEQFHSPKNLAMALSVEVAEIVEHFQWLTEEQSKNPPPEKLAEIREEIGDVMIYLVELADKLGVDPVEAAKAKLEISTDRNIQQNWSKAKPPSTRSTLDAADIRHHRPCRQSRVRRPAT